MLDSTNLYDRLVHDEWLGLFPYHIRTKLNSQAEVRQYKAGEPIFLKGEEGEWLAVVLTGRVRIRLSSHDKEMLISMVERNELFGERAVFDGLPRSGDAIAEEDTTCLIYYRKDLLPAMFSCPETMMYVIKIMCIRVVRYMNTMELYALQNLPTRLANFLDFLGQKYGKKDENGAIALQFNLSQTDLSQQIASSRESINRQMKQFAEAGLINMEGGDIVITDVVGLKKLCETHTEIPVL